MSLTPSSITRLHEPDVIEKLMNTCILIVALGGCTHVHAYMSTYIVNQLLVFSMTSPKLTRKIDSMKLIKKMLHFVPSSLR
mgnify:CR=1 FL=1